MGGGKGSGGNLQLNKNKVICKNLLSLFFNVEILGEKEFIITPMNINDENK